MPIPTDRNELARYLNEVYVRPWMDARRNGSFNQRCDRIEERYLSLHKPLGLSKDDPWIAVSLVYPQTMTAYGLTARAVRSVVAKPVGQEDAEGAKRMEKVCEVKFEEGELYDAVDRAQLFFFLYGRGSVRARVGRRNFQIDAICPDPRDVIPDPESKARNHRDSRGTLYLYEVDLDEARKMWGPEIQPSAAYQSHREGKQTSATAASKAAAADLEWWCPADGKVYYDGQLLILDNPDEFETAVPEEDRDQFTISSWDTGKAGGYWRTTTLVFGGPEGVEVVEDKPTGTSGAEWKHVVMDHTKRGVEGAVGLGQRMVGLTDAVSGTISLAMRNAIRAGALMTLFEDQLTPDQINAITRGEDVVIDGLGKDVKEKVHQLKYAENRAEVLFNVALRLLSVAETTGGVPDVASGRTPRNPSSGAVIENLVDAAANVVVHASKSITDFSSDLAKHAGELIQRKIPYGHIVTIENDETGKSEQITIGVLPPEGEQPLLRLLNDRSAPLAYDVSISIDIEESVKRGKREAEAERLLDGKHIDLEAYFELKQDKKGQTILEGLTERNQARQLVQYIQDRPELQAQIQSLMELEAQNAALGGALIEQEDDT